MSDPEKEGATGNGHKRGRPRTDEPCTSVSTWLPASHHDRLIQLAQSRDQSVSSLVRQLLIFRLR